MNPDRYRDAKVKKIINYFFCSQLIKYASYHDKEILHSFRKFTKGSNRKIINYFSPLRALKNENL